MKPVICVAIAALGLSACTVVPPQGPTVMALPPAGKDFAQFQREDATCQQAARTSLGLTEPQAAANQAALGSAAIGTAVGTAAGALIGAATGNLGAGAAIGAGVGLVGGSAVGVGAAQNTTLSLQDRFDVTYAQCMASFGNTIQPRRVNVPVPVAPVYDPYWRGGRFGPGFGWGGRW